MAGTAPAIRREWLTVAEAEAMTGIGRKELYEALQAGELPGNQRVRNGKWRVHVDDVRNWMRGQATPASA